MKDARNESSGGGGSTTAAGAGPGPGKQTLTQALGTGAEHGAGHRTLTAIALDRATRANPLYHAQLRFDPAPFGAGNDVSTKSFATAVGDYQQSHDLAFDGMAGPITTKAIGALPADATPAPGHAPGPGHAPAPGHASGPTPAPGPAPAGPTPEAPVPAAPPPPAPAPAQPRTEQTEYGSFVVYPDDFVGPLPANKPPAENMHEAEFRRVLAQRQTAAVAQRDHAISRVDDLLSYGAFDWAITDGEATEALNVLGALTMSQLKIAVGKINAQRLLDNLPAGLRRTPAFARFIIAMGPDKYRPYITELLSYGVLDWAIRDAEVEVVTDILATLPPPQQIAFLRTLDATHLSRLARNLSRGVQVSNDVLKAIFGATPDSDLAALEATFERRFRVDLSTWFVRRWQMSVKQQWDAPGLRRLWQLVEQLPPDHVQNNPRLEALLRADKKDGSGVYYGGPDAAVVSYADVDALGGFGSIMQPDATGAQKNVALNTNVNVFNAVVRHEIGHAVDAKIGASIDGGYVRTAANAGQWRTYGSAGDFVDAIVTAGGGMSGHGYANEQVYRKAMERAVSKSEDFAAALHGVDASVAVPDATIGGPVAAVYDKARWHPDASPWYSGLDRQDVGGRLWQQPYPRGNYASFIKGARAAHGVSAYQFRAPGEWFAEAYAVYYSDPDTAPGTQMGTRLRTRDAGTADWFDTNVDKGHSIAHETGQGGGGAGGGGAGRAPAVSSGGGGGAGGGRAAGGGSGVAG